MILSLALFVAAALGGVVLFALRLRGGNPPLPLAVGHGLLAAAGLVVLVIHLVADGWSTLPGTACVLLVLAALGGFVVFGMHLRERLIPVPLTVVHALLAVAGVGLLVAAVVLGDGGGAGTAAG